MVLDVLPTITRITLAKPLCGRYCQSYCLLSLVNVSTPHSVQGLDGWDGLEGGKA